MFVNSCISTLILFVIGVQSNDHEGQPCYHTTKNLIGTCTLLINCDSAFKEVQNQVFPQICGLGPTAPIVCCPNPKIENKARAKCLEYSKLRKGKCNIEFNRSVNFTDAVGKEFPHMAILGYSDSVFKGRTYLCGGTLISERFVLTMADCAITLKSFLWRFVRLGDLNLAENDDDAKPQEFNIEQIIIHPDYTPLKDYNDLALIKLDKNVEFTPYVFPTCLHVEKKLDTNGKLLSAGWARSSFGGDSTNQKIRRILLDVGKYEHCKEWYLTDEDWTQSRFEDLMICAESTPSCYWSWGVSLQTLHGDVDCMYDMVGMLTFSTRCFFEEFPQVFVRISHYVEWIEKIVWPQKTLF